MEYFKLLNLEKEPFSNSPDPDYFFKSRQHKACLQKLELSLRLRRGLNVVIGEVGTGKTTLCRQIIKRFSRDEEFETHLILDPHMADPKAFLQTMARMFEREPRLPGGEWSDYKEFIKQYLYHRGVEENRIVVLIIDEGQKIPPPILEILRELLNYETNEYKLLQIVIFAQREFEQILDAHANFADRINLLHVLGPLGFQDTRLMIDYRLQKAGAENSLNSLLSFSALVAIFRATGGYPRKIVNLCHRIMLAMIVKNKKRAGWRLVRSCVNRTSAGTSVGWHKPAGVLLVVLGVAGLAYTGFIPEKEANEREEPAHQQTFSIEEKAVQPVPPVPREKPEPSSPVAAGSQGDVLPEPAPVVESDDRQAQEEGGVYQASVENAAPAVEPIPDAEKKPIETADESGTVAEVRPQPESLGIIRMEAGETLSWVMIKVYGEYTNLRRRTISASNPGLLDLDNIYSGQAVGFPAMTYEQLEVPKQRHWVRVGRLTTVSAALDLVRAYSTRAAPLRIVPTWQRERGLQFDVIFWGCFASQDQAVRYQTTLPEKVQAKSEIMPGWEADAVFYANPCPGVG